MIDMENNGAPEMHKVKRPRAIQACDLCRLKKNKCDEEYPCSLCKARNAKCVYRGAEKRRRRSYSDYLYQLDEHADSSPTTISTKGAAAYTPSQSSRYDCGVQQQNIEHTAHRENAQSSNGHASKEVSGVNRHTRNVEFYGSSSSVALLSRVGKSGDTGDTLGGDEGEEELVSSLHNTAFSPGITEHSETSKVVHKSPSNSMTHYQQCRPFLDNFFTTLHYIHPILDKHEFLSKCALLWTNSLKSPCQSFIALYYSILSLGALVGVREDDEIDGVGNLQWSRIFFEEARTRANMSMMTDLEMVQCYLFMAKVCQNELNHHSSYMYCGLAVRTALAIGINREPQPNNKRDIGLLRAESRTWWGLYSLETETSFAVGRPDSLGADMYHNRCYPAIRDDTMSSFEPSDSMEAPICAIIEVMVAFARITRNVVLGIYLGDSNLQQSIALAEKIEHDLERWLETLPATIRPSKEAEEQKPLKKLKDPQYAKKQRLVLRIRYHNLRIMLFGSFLTRPSALERATAVGLQQGIEKCLDSAKQTIEIIYKTCENNDFFRTWFYNTTYTVFATSIILVYISQQPEDSELASLFKLVEMAIEILEIMDESVVAMKAAKIIQAALTRARRSSGPPVETAPLELDKSAPLNSYLGLLDFIEGDLNVNFPFQFDDTAELYPLDVTEHEQNPF